MVDSSQKIAKNWKNRMLDIYLEHPDWNSTEIREQLIAWIGKEKAPGKSSVQKEKQRLKEEYGKRRVTLSRERRELSPRISTMTLPWRNLQ